MTPVRICLTAPLEGLIADLVRRYLQRHDSATRFIQDLAASEVAATSTRLHAIQQKTQCLELIDRADLSPGILTIHLSSGELAAALECDACVLIRMN